MQFDPHSRVKRHNFWRENQIYTVKNGDNKPKLYVLDMFPYPSGAGLHVGHPLGYIASDIYSRYMRMQGFNVLHPMGFDSFGLPAEQYAIQTGTHPATSTKTNIDTYKKQLENLGLSYDWNREINTSDPEYYKWTQWIFLKLFDHYYDITQDKALPLDTLIDHFMKLGNKDIKAAHSEKKEFDAAQWMSFSAKEKDDILMNYRLAYRNTGYVNWCEKLGTVLANDEVKNGLSERGGYPVERKEMKQWALRITSYVERLLGDLDTLDWSDALKAMQKNWIGKSEGALVTFSIDKLDISFEVFTTRPDTIFGVTFIAIAPESTLIPSLLNNENKQIIEEYITYTQTKSELERKSDSSGSTGVFTGAYGVNPITGKKVPIWISEYVVGDYGTGAIMGVPAEDERDRAFAEKNKIEIIEIINRDNDQIEIMMNSGLLNNKTIPEATQIILEEITQKKIGKKQTSYRLRDASFSRQRYWGEPIPIEYDEDGVSYALSEDELPLLLPVIDDFQPQNGKSPLQNNDTWVHHNGRIRETDTMPGYAGSSRYYLRYMDPQNTKEFAAKEVIDYRQNIDLYIGGTEHAVGHLMYSRFFHKFLFDIGYVNTLEPFKKLFNQGMIEGVIEYLYFRKEKINNRTVYVSSSLVNETNKNQFSQLPIHINYVMDYGLPTSYINKESIKGLGQWRPEFADALYEYTDGIYDPKKDDTLMKDFKLTTLSEKGKMSKSYFNVINPDSIIGKYGADCFRMYEMFLGPINQSKPWITNGIDGVYKFLKKVWNLCYGENEPLILDNTSPSPQELKIIHTCIKKISEDIKNLSLNTCISTFMIAVNDLKNINSKNRQIVETLLCLLAPFAPFMTEELRHLLGNKESIHLQQYPIFEGKYLIENDVIYPVSINGKRKTEIKLPIDLTNEEIGKRVMEIEIIKNIIASQEIKKFIIVPQRMVNIVI